MCSEAADLAIIQHSFTTGGLGWVEDNMEDDEDAAEDDGGDSPLHVSKRARHGDGRGDGRGCGGGGGRGRGRGRGRGGGQTMDPLQSMFCEFMGKVIEKL